MAKNCKDDFFIKSDLGCGQFIKKNKPDLKDFLDESKVKIV